MVTVLQITEVWSASTVSMLAVFRILPVLLNLAISNGQKIKKIKIDIKVLNGYKFISVFEEERKKGLATHEALIEFRAEVRSELRTIKWMLGVNIAFIIGIILLVLRLS